MVTITHSAFELGQAEAYNLYPVTALFLSVLEKWEFMDWAHANHITLFEDCDGTDGTPTQMLSEARYTKSSGVNFYVREADMILIKLKYCGVTHA